MKYVKRNGGKDIMMTSTELIVVICGLILTALAIVVAIQKFKALELLAMVEEDLANFYVPEILQIHDTENDKTAETDTNNDNVDTTKEEDEHEPDSDDISVPVG